MNTTRDNPFRAAQEASRLRDDGEDSFDVTAPSRLLRQELARRNPRTAADLADIRRFVLRHPMLSVGLAAGAGLALGTLSRRRR